MVFGILIDPPSLKIILPYGIEQLESRQAFWGKYAQIFGQTPL